MLTERSKKIRRDIIDLSQANFGYHYGGSFSCVEILIALFDHVLQPEDKFIMSKGHACWGYYVLLREQGYSPLLEGHPHLDESNGVNFTSGSMGHGLPAAVGMAMARKINKKTGRIFVLIGDGECQEGTTWESTLIGGKFALNNLTVIVDNNNIQGSGFVSEILDIKPMQAMAKAANWVTNFIDGHDIESLTQNLLKKSSKPKLIIAKTTKGKGVSFMENVPAWHAKFLDSEHEKIAKEELA
jgi:transketolase